MQGHLSCKKRKKSCLCQHSLASLISNFGCLHGQSGKSQPFFLLWHKVAKHMWKWDGNHGAQHVNIFMCISSLHFSFSEKKGGGTFGGSEMEWRVERLYLNLVSTSYHSTQSPGSPSEVPEREQPWVWPSKTPRCPYKWVRSQESKRRSVHLALFYN